MYTRAGRPTAGVSGYPLIVKELDMEGSLVKTYTKAGKVPTGYFQIRSGVKVQITKEEFVKLSKAKK